LVLDKAYVVPEHELQEKQVSINYDKEKYREMILDAAETV
jgi:hypothetical protein